MKKNQLNVIKFSVLASLGMILLFVGVFSYDFSPRQTEVTKTITVQPQ